MSKECQFISNVSTATGFKLVDFIKNISRMSGKPDVEELDTCDLDQFREELVIPFSNDDFFDASFQRGVFHQSDGADFLFYLLWTDKDSAIKQSYLQKRVPAKMPAQVDPQSLDPNHLKFFADKSALFAKFIHEPLVQAKLSEMESQYYAALSWNFASEVASKNIPDLENKVGGIDYALHSLYDDLADRSMGPVWGWRIGDWVWNKGVRNIFALGAMAYAGWYGKMVMAPAGGVLADFSDKLGAELTRALIEPDYTLSEAAGEIAYQAPFSVAKGLSFQFGFWPGAFTFAGLTGLERFGDPKDASPWQNRAMSGGVDGAVTLGVTLIGAKVVGTVKPRLARYFDETPSRDIVLPKFRRELVVLEKIKLPEAGTLATDSPPPPPPPSGGTFPKRVKRPVEERVPVAWRNRKPEAASVEKVPRPLTVRSRIVCTMEKTKLGEETYQFLDESFQKRLDGLMERVRVAVEEGIDFTRLKNVQRVYGESDKKVFWEARVLTSAKPRVYFELSGSNGERTITILGYSLGDHEQQGMISRIIASLKATN